MSGRRYLRAELHVDRGQVDLATIREVAIRRQELERLPGDLAVLDETDECTSSEIESWCILAKSTDVLARGF